MPAQQEAPAVNPVVSATGDEGNETTNHQEEGSTMTVHNPRDFIRDIADIPTVDDTLAIGAQFQVDYDGMEHRLILISDHAIDLAQLPALQAALATAVETLKVA